MLLFHIQGTQRRVFVEVISDISTISRCSFLNTEDFSLRLIITRIIYKLEKQDFLNCTVLNFVLQFIRRATITILSYPCLRAFYLDTSKHKRTSYDYKSPSSQISCIHCQCNTLNDIKFALKIL